MIFCKRCGQKAQKRPILELVYAETFDIAFESMRDNDICFSTLEIEELLSFFDEIENVGEKDFIS